MATSSLKTWLQGALAGALLRFSVVTTPSPAHRMIPLARGRGMHVKTYSTYMADCQRAAAHFVGTFPSGVPLLVTVCIVGQRPKASILLAPRGDVDNYVKGAMDGCTKAGLWDDDTQVHACLIYKRWSNPGELAGVRMQVGVLNPEAMNEMEELTDV